MYGEVVWLDGNSVDIIGVGNLGHLTPCCNTKLLVFFCQAAIASPHSHAAPQLSDPGSSARGGGSLVLLVSRISAGWGEIEEDQGTPGLFFLGAQTCHGFAS